MGAGGPFNLFRLVADGLHAFTKIVLIKKLRRTKNAGEVSLKTQMLYLLVFVTRYIDLLYIWKMSFSLLTIYNTIFKIFFIATSIYTIWLIAFRLGVTYSPAIDQAPLPIIIGVALILAIIPTVMVHSYKILTYFTSFSQFLECLAIIPQIMMLLELGESTTFGPDYIAAMGGYRMLYVANWIWRWARSDPEHRPATSWVKWITGIAHTVLYVEFVWTWFKGRMKGRRSVLPIEGQGQVSANNIVGNSSPDDMMSGQVSTTVSSISQKRGRRIYGNKKEGSYVYSGLEGRGDRGRVFNGITGIKHVVTNIFHKKDTWNAK